MQSSIPAMNVESDDTASCQYNKPSVRIRQRTAVIATASASVTAACWLLSLASLSSSPVHAFSPEGASIRHQRSTTTARHFRQEEYQEAGELPSLAEIAAAGISSAPFDTSSPSTGTRLSTFGLGSSDESFVPLSFSSLETDKSSYLPTWLQQLEDAAKVDYASSNKLYELHDAMIHSYLTEEEAEIVLSAVKEASNGNAEKLMGAAEFCLILVETMEMGVHALVAAAFHFCTCVTLREKLAISIAASSASSTGKNTMSPSAFWDKHYDFETDSSILFSNEHLLSSDASDIARNAAKLKRSEMVAASLVQCAEQANADVNNDKARKFKQDAENLRSLLLTETGDWRALAIRCAACLYRLRGLLKSRENNGSDSNLTREEVIVSKQAISIYAPLASRLGMHRLKNEMESAAFQILYKRQYNAVISLTEEEEESDYYVHQSCLGFDGTSTVGQEMQNVLNDITEKVKILLQNDPTFMEHAHHVEVSARVKEPYSLWKKMLRLQTRNIFDVPDALALRVIVDAQKQFDDENDEITRSRERCLCYYIQKRFTEGWDNLGNDNGSVDVEICRVKDYIMHPKRNGYQSLHFTSLTQYGGKDWPFEMQIRSGEMHRVAEYGLAAHWDYKLRSKGTSFSSISQASCQDEFQSSLCGEEQWKQIDENSNLDALNSDQTMSTLGSSNSKFVWSDYNHDRTSAKINDSPNTSTLHPHLHFLERNKIRKDRAKAQAERLAPYIEALSTTQLDLANSFVFVFLSSSSVKLQHHVCDGILALPKGSCVIDALREGERRYGVDLVSYSRSDSANDSIVHNGIGEAKMTQRLSNGDFLIVPSLEVNSC